MLTHTGPEGGGGGMLAIESASALANGLWRFLMTDVAPPCACGDGEEARRRRRPTVPQIEGMLRQWEAGLRRRPTLNTKAAGHAGRTETMRTVAHRLLVPVMLPYHPEAALELLCDQAVGSGCIEYLPIPPRLHDGHHALQPGTGCRQG